MYNLITIGDATLDTFVIIDPASKQTKIDKKKKLLSLHYGDKIYIEKTDQSIGGNAANVAVGVKKLGFKTAIVTELGDDVTGQLIEHELKEAGVATDYVKVLTNKESRYSIVLNYEAERTILSYHAPRQYTLPELPKTDWIYYTSLGKTFEAIQKKLEQHLTKHENVKLAMNPGSYQLEHGIEAIRRMLKRTDVLFVNVEEAIKLVGKKQTIPQLMKSLRRAGVGTVAITDGDRGAAIMNDTEAYSMVPYNVKAVGKTGAGDAFASGCLSAIMMKKSIDEALTWGIANSASVVQKIGAQHGLLSKAGIAKLVASFPNYSPKTLSN